MPEEATKRRGPLHTLRRLTTARLDVRRRCWPQKLNVGSHGMRLSNPATHITTIFHLESCHFQARAKRRKNLTLAAAICDCQIMQPTLSQCLIGKHVTFFLAREIHASRLACPTNVVLLRFKRVWNKYYMCVEKSV